MHRGIFYRRRTHLIADIQGEILQIHRMGLLDLLLTDKTAEAAAKKAGGPARKHILWATDAYEGRGPEYRRNRPITPALITGENGDVIKTRARKALEQQTERTRRHAEVFTPLAVIEQMVRLADAAWFGRKRDGFDFDEERIPFTRKKNWRRYVDARRMEITCGEAPYLVTRYDAATGEALPIAARVGLLDRKLRAVNENAADEAAWRKWALRAFQSTYGYEFQGDNVLIARVNLLMTFEEYLYARWKRKPTAEEYRTIANVIAWNIWQMDGLTGAVPYCRDDAWREANLFEPDEPEPLLEETPLQPRCRIYDWRRKNSLDYMDVNTGGRNMKFDFIIGNPPYQDETIGGNKGFAPPIYHLFMDESYKLSDRVELIHPARFLFNAGSTPKAWNKKMLNDPHLKVLWYEQDSSKIFNGTDIKGGVVVTLHDATKDFGVIGTFTTYTELNTILKKVDNHSDFKTFSAIVISRTSYRLTEKMHKDHPEAIRQLSKGHAYDMATNIFDRIPQVFSNTLPEDGHDYIQILGRENNERTYKYIRRDYVNNVKNLDKHKIFLSKANGTGTFGETLSSLILANPGIGATETFLGVGFFDTAKEATACLKYVKTKFTRTLLGILKTTQDITPEKWKYVPLQDFTASSDIDWSQSVADIDRQLYAKYGLDEKEISFIESHVKEMK